MPNFCLTPEAADKFKKEIIAGTINPESLASMTSAERHAVFAKSLGESNAGPVNALFESKLLLKNQQAGMINWATKVLGKNTPAAKDIISKIQRLDKVLNPKEQSAFLEDLAAQKLGVKLTYEEAQKITELSKAVQDAKAKMLPDFTWPTKEDGLQYGASKRALQRYVNELKGPRPSGFASPFKQSSTGLKIEAAVGDVKASVQFIADNSRSLVASVDNSFWGNQGIRVALNPKYVNLWGRNFIKSFNDIYQVLAKGNAKGDAIIDATMAEIFSRKNSLNGRYEMGQKLDIGTGEEDIPTSLPSRLGEIPVIRRIPVIKSIFGAAGRIFKASEVAYEAGAMRLRADVADKVYDMAEKTGIDMKDVKEIGSRNMLVNSMTGRGHIGSANAGQLTNSAFFSVRFFKSHLDFLTAHVFDPKVSASVKFEAFKNILYVVSTTAVILGIAKALNHDDTYNPFDPRSSDFGKVKIGNTRINIAPYASVVVLAARILTQSSRSTSTGKVTKLGARDKQGNPLYGGPTGMTVFWDFTENKFSPMFSILADLAKQQTFNREKPTLKNETEAITVPMSATTAIELEKDKGSNQLLDLLLNAINAEGFNVNTYATAPPKAEAKPKFKY